MPSHMSIKHSYACWSFSFLPEPVLSELAEELRMLMLNVDHVLLELRAIFTPNEAFRPARREHNHGLLQYLLRFRKMARHRACCQGYWCLEYAAHFRADRGCLTIGGFHSFLLRHEARNAALRLDGSRRQIEAAFLRARFWNPFRLIAAGVKSALQRETSSRNLLLLADSSVPAGELDLLRTLAGSLAKCRVVRADWSLREADPKEVDDMVGPDLSDLVFVRQNAELFGQEEDQCEVASVVELIRAHTRCRAVLHTEALFPGAQAVAENLVAHCVTRCGSLTTCCLQEAVLRYSYMAQHEFPLQDGAD